MTSPTLKYPTFEDWYFEIENYSLRAERFWESLDQFGPNATRANLEIWLRAAFDSARETTNESCTVYHGL